MIIVRFFRTVSDIKKKWTNIKDSFVKDVKGNKPRKTLRLPEHRKKYYLFDHLQFLMPFIQSVGGGPRSAEDGAGLPVSKKIRKNTLHGEGPSRNGPSMMATVPLETAAQRPETLQPDVQQHADLLNNFTSKTATNALCQLDGDLSFMVSLLPTIKSMNEKQKINFKIGVLQLMSQIKFDEVQNHPQGVNSYEQSNATTANNIFPGPHQLQRQVQASGRNPPVNVAVSSTQQLQQHHHHNKKPSAEHESSRVKQEVVDSSPGSSSWCHDNDTSTEEDVEFTRDRNT